MEKLNRRLLLQNKLYRHLLTAGCKNNFDIFLPKLLNLFISITGGSQAYMEFQDNRGKSFWTYQSFSNSEIQNIRNTISKGIIAEALKNRTVVQTVSALSDPRFSSRESVRSAKIEAVLCVPIHTDQIQGVIYLQGGNGFRPYDDENIRDSRLIVDHITPLMEQIYLNRKKPTDYDHTACLRKQYNIPGIIGRSMPLKRVLKTASKVAPLNLNLLLTGESGTGKTQLAEMVHQNSPRKNSPFVELNCASLPETLLENELFGSVEGGHSSATRPVQGKVAAARGGTLFLDEIGELPFNIQAKLLQLLHSGFYYPLGSSKQVKADIRIITATNINLKKAVQQKKFREDLFYRINVFSIHMPNLSERGADLTDLAFFFCKESCQKHGLPEITITPSVLNILYNKTWKGNIRELKHAIESATIYAAIDGKRKILPSHLFPDNATSQEQNEYISSFKEATLLFQQEFLKKNLEVRNWNISRTSRELSISRSQLNNLIRTFRLKRKARLQETANVSPHLV